MVQGDRSHQVFNAKFTKRVAPSSAGDIAEVEQDLRTDCESSVDLGRKGSRGLIVLCRVPSVTQLCERTRSGLVCTLQELCRQNQVVR